MQNSNNQRKADGGALEFSWHANSVEECLRKLACPHDILRTGLSSGEATTRLRRYGPNKLTEKAKVSLLQRIWNRVNNALVGILVLVAIVFALRAATATDAQSKITNWIHAGSIAFFIIPCSCNINLSKGGDAGQAADALRAMLSSDAMVLRKDGREIKVRAEDLVPGDIVELSTGDRVPADLRMAKVNNLTCQEAALTGESVPVEKCTEAIQSSDWDSPTQQPLGERRNMCFSATLVAQGSGVGIVVATGDQTEIGTIHTLVNKLETKRTSYLNQIDTVFKYLAFLIILTSLATWLTAYFIAGLSASDALTTALSCAVAMLPVGLKAIVGMVYAWAVSNMAYKNAIIRALPAVDTPGSVTVICSDKTGILTKNEMSLVAFVTAGKRFKFDVHAEKRSPANVVVDNTYMATRANHSKFLSRGDVIRTGASAFRKTRRGRGRSKHTFPFSIGSTFQTSHPTMGYTEGVEPPNHPMDLGDDVPASFSELPEQADTQTNEAGIVLTEGSGDAKSHDDVTNDTAFTTSTHQSADLLDIMFLRQLLGGGILCSKCILGENGRRVNEVGNPTELSILRAAYFGDVNVAELKSSSPVIAEVPFSSEYKFMATVHDPVQENDTNDYDGKLIVHVKGAPDRLIPFCKYQAIGGSIRVRDLEPVDRNYWVDQIAILSSHGLRVIALTRGTLEQSSVGKGDQLGPEFVTEREEPWLTIVGLCAIMDPPRPECVQAIHEAHTAGVRVVMITGDHKDTAVAIGGTLGIVDDDHPNAITGPELDGMTDEELRLEVQNYNVFARSSPQNKIMIVKALQYSGEVCCMTGDRVNDAPALKAADVGVAMGKESTDYARAASDMILADDNFATIVSAVKEGRTVWDNLRKVLLVSTPISNAQGMSVLFGLLFGLKKSPWTSMQVLYSNLICACALGFVCAAEPAEEGIMDQPPRQVGKRMIGRFLLLRILIGTATLVICVVGSVFWARDKGYNENQLHSQALNVLNFGAISITMSARFARKSAFSARSFHGNKLAGWSYGIVVALQVIITYTPGLNSIIFHMEGMDGWQWGVVLLGMVITFVVMESEKAVRNYLHDLKYDVDDLDYGPFDAPNDRDTTPLPDEIRRLHW